MAAQCSHLSFPAQYNLSLMGHSTINIKRNSISDEGAALEWSSGRSSGMISSSPTGSSRKGPRDVSDSWLLKTRYDVTSLNGFILYIYVLSGRPIPLLVEHELKWHVLLNFNRGGTKRRYLERPIKNSCRIWRDQRCLIVP